VEQPVGFRAQPVRHGAQAGLPGGNEAAVSGTASVAADAPQRLPARCTAVPNTRRAAEAATPELIGTPPSGRLDAGSAAPAAAAQAEHAQAGAALSLACASEGGGARAAPYASAPDPAPALVSASASPFAAAARAAAPGWDSAAPGALGAAAGRPESARAAGAGGAVAAAAAGGEGGLRGASEGLAAALVEQTLLAMPRRPDAVTHIRCASAAAPAAPEAVADKPQGRVATARSALRAPLAPQERGRGSRGA
jgi:hypothetical protein